eukprot:TRINITY_DN7434_c0_g1_i1.p1 TRINITY_DN7434_c0_g1~~TRINITY_DN7434_c0_g1_i1.p1  ORF type:complete len:324 (-),score=117.02 TRINITY_DN7434_c0_g1_i1:19-990(-)
MENKKVEQEDKYQKTIEKYMSQNDELSKLRLKHYLEKKERGRIIQNLPLEQRLGKHLQNVMGCKEKKKNNVCNKCWVVPEHCMCKQFFQKERLPFDHNLIFFLHHKEYLRSTNTGVDVINNCSKASMSVLGFDKWEEDLENLRKTSNCFVLFCSTKSVTLSEAMSEKNEKFNKDLPVNFIIPDATWPNAKWMAQKVFGEMTHVKLDSIPKKTNIGMRKQSSDYRLTTGEACIYLIQKFPGNEEMIERIWECMNYRKKIMRPAKVFPNHAPKEDLVKKTDDNINNNNVVDQQEQVVHTLAEKIDELKIDEKNENLKNEIIIENK